MKKQGALANALRNSGAAVAASPAPEMLVASEPAVASSLSRAGTKPITLHYPDEVRRQLKGMAAELDRTMEDLGAEAFNMLFAKYRKPELAPRKSNK